MRQMTLLLVCWLVHVASASGQVLLTGETGGSGSQAVAVTASFIAQKDFGNLTNLWAQYGYGLTDRVDIFAAYGDITVFGQLQHYVGIGSNIAVLKRRRDQVDVSFFSNVSLPLTRREQAATVLVTLAVIASRPVQLGAAHITPYGGLETIVPVGDRARGIFTPIETLHAGVFGIAVPLHKTWAAYAEYNYGENLRSSGVGIAITIPRR
jgi:hypothetical protein